MEMPTSVVQTEYYPNSGIRSQRHGQLSRIVFFLIGGLLVFNLPLFPAAQNSLRASDVIGVICLPLAVAGVLKMRGPILTWVMIWAIGLCLVLLAALSFGAGDMGRFVSVARVGIAIVCANVITANCSADSTRAALFGGMCAGSLLGLLVCYGQTLHIGFFQSLLPPDANETSIFEAIRPAGIWEHANAAAQISMVGAAAAFLIWPKSASRHFWTLALYLSIALGTYLVIQSRAAVVVAVCLGGLFILQQSRPVAKVIAATVATGLIIVVLVSPETILGQRWTGTFSGQSTADQAADRVRSMWNGLVLTLQHPLGLMSQQRTDAFLASTRSVAVHNGFIHFMLVLGPLVGSLLLGLAGKAAYLATRTNLNRPYGYALGSIAFMLLFEDASFLPPVLTVSALIVTMVLSDVKRDAP